MKRTGCLVRIAAALCRSDEPLLRLVFSEALSTGVSSVSIREVILTAYLFDGYPAALEGFRLLSEMTESPPEDVEDLVYTSEAVRIWRMRGSSLCRKVYGPQYEPLMKRVKTFAPELSDSMIVEGYGKVLSRGGIDIVSRELCVVAILSVKSRPRQLLSHALGALRLGASAAMLRSTLEQIENMLLESDKPAIREIIECAITTLNAP